MEEREYYERAWNMPQYRKMSPALFHYKEIIKHLKPEPGDTFVDFGAGPGLADLELKKSGMSVTMLDFAHNCLDPTVIEHLDNNLKFILTDLVNIPELKSKYGFCIDVLEHIPEHHVDKVLCNIRETCTDGVFLVISTVPDNFGPAFFGKPLHLTVKEGMWWTHKLKLAGFTIETYLKGPKLIAYHCT